MRIVGTKFYGHESALCLLDTKQKTVFAMSTERVTRIKHDSIGITPILEAYDFNDVDCVTHSFADFENKGQDNELRGKMTCNKELDLLIRSFFSPLYAKDLNISKKARKKIILKLGSSRYSDADIEKVIEQEQNDSRNKNNTTIFELRRILLHIIKNNKDTKIIIANIFFTFLINFKL